MSMILYKITDEYISFLADNDSKVLSSHKKDRTFQRPHLGIVINNSNMPYFIPLSSPDQKDYINGNPRKSTLAIKRLNFKNEFVGKLLLNNMIPAPKSEIEPIDLSFSNKTENEKKYIRLLKKQLAAISLIKKEINTSANLVYSQKLNETNKNYWKEKIVPGYLNATVDFTLLEQKCLEWIAKQGTNKNILTE